MTRFTHILAPLALAVAFLPVAANAAAPSTKMSYSNAAQIHVADDLAPVHPVSISGLVIVHSGIDPNAFRDSVGG